MGESYRGLTIRIGADTSSLQKALRGVNGAISSTQSELRKVKQALNFDASGVKAAAEGMQLASNRAAELEQKLRTLRKAEQQLANTEAGKRLANSMYDAQAAVVKAKNEYNDLNAAIERTKRAISTATKGKVNLVGVEGEELDRMVAGLTNAKGEVRELAQELQRLRSMWGGVSTELDMSKQAAQLQDCRIEAAKVESELRSLSERATALSATRFGNALKEQMQDAVASMRTADATMDSLKAELATLDDALKLNPAALDTARLKMQNLQQQAQAATDRIEAMQEQMQAIARSVGADRIASDFASAHSLVRQTTAELEQMNTELSKARARMNELASESASLRLNGDDAGFRRVNAELEAAQANVRQLAEQQKAAMSAFETAQAVAEYRSLETQVQKTKAEIQQLNSQMAGSGKSAGASFSAMTTLGLSFYSTLTPAVQQFGSYAVQSANDIDAAYRNMRKTVQGNEGDFQELLDSAKEFSQSNFTSADTLLQIEAMGGQLGIAVENLDEFAKTAANLDIATDLSAEDISTAMGQLSGIMTDLTADKFPSFGDALVRLGNNAPAVESSIVEITKRIGSMGSIVGFSTPELLAWSTAIASTGQNSEAAGTAISKTMSDIEQAVAEGGDKLQAWADVAQMSAEDFARAWQESPSDAMKSFVEGLRDIDKAGGSVDSTLSDLGINEVRQKQALQGLTQTVGDLNSYLQMSNDAWNGVTDRWGEAGDAANEASKKSEGFSGQLQILKNNAQVFSSEMAEALVPVLKIATDVIQDLTTWFRGLSPELQSLIAGGIALSGAIGPAMTVIAAGGNALSQFRDRMASSRDAMSQVAGAASNMSGPLGTAATKTQALTGKQKALSSAMNIASGAIGAFGTACKAVGWTLLIAEAGNLIGKFAEAQSRASQLEEATEGLRSATASAKTAFSETSAELGNSAGDYEVTQDSVDELVSSYVEMKREAEDTFSEMGTNAALLQNYTSTISELANQSNLSAEDQARLQAAVQGFNDVCGTSISVIDPLNGKLSESVDTVLQLSDAYLQLAEAQAMQELYTDAVKTRIEAERDLAEATEKLNSMDPGEGLKVGDVWVWEDADKAAYNDQLKLVEQLSDTYNSAAADEAYFGEQVEHTSAALAASTENLSGFIASSAEMKTGLEESGQSAEALTESLSQLGYGTDMLSSMSPEQLQALAANYDGTFQSIIDTLATFGPQFMTQGMQAAQNWYLGFSTGTQNSLTAVTNMGTYTLMQLQTMAQQFGIQGDTAVRAWCSALQLGAEPSAAAAMALTGMTEQQFSGLAQQVAAKGTDAVTQLCQAIASGADPVAAAAAILSGSAENAYGPDLVPKTEEAISGASGSAAGGDTSGFSTYGENAEAAYGESFNPEPPTTSGLENANATAAGADVSGFRSWGVNANNAIQGSIQRLDIGGILEPPLQEGTQIAEAEGTNTGQAYPEGVNGTVGQTQAAAQAHANATTAMNANVGSAFGWGSSMGSNFASGLLSQLGAVQSASSQLAAAAAGPLHHSTPDFGPLHDDDEWGGHLADNFADGITSGTPKVAKASLGIAQTVADYLEHSSPTKGPLSVGEWVFGYHTAINYADGLYSGSGDVGRAASGLSGAVKDELSEVDKWLEDYLAKVDRLYGGFEAQIAEHAEEVQGLIWGVWQSMADDEWARPFKGNVYESMKLIEEAGYDLDSWKDKLAQAAEEQVEWQRKLEDLEWDTREQEKKKAEADEWDEFDQRSYDEWMRSRQDTLDEYAEWLAEYEELKAVEASLTASMPELDEWQDLYKMKSDVTAMTDDAEALSDALWDAGQSGATFSQEFIDYIKDNGPEAAHALSQLTDLGKDQLQELSDSFRDAALAEREAELNARSLYVNSLQYTNFKTQKAQLLDFRETCLDVKEAVYSNDGLSWAFEQTGTYIEGFALDLESLNMTMEDFQSYYDGFVDSVSNGFSLLANENMTSLDEWSDTLVSNGQIAKDWSEDLKKVFGTLGTGPEVDAFRQEVLEGGYEKWGRIIDELAEQDEASMKRYLDTFNTSLEEAQIYGIEAFKALSPGEEIVNSLIEGMQEKQGDMNAAMQGASDAANDAMQATKPEWFDTGAIVAGELEYGIRSQTSSIAAAAAETVRRAIEAARAAAGSGTGAAISGATTAAGIIGSGVSRSGYAAVKAMPAMAPMAARASQAVNSVTNNNQTVNMTFNVSTQPGQKVDVRALAKEMNRMQERAMRARGTY